MARKIIILRKNIPEIGKQIGDVSDVLDGSQFEGTEVAKVGQTFVRVLVTDMPADTQLEAELKRGIKRFKTPDINDPFYQELLTNGIVTVDLATLANYIEIV